MVLTIKDKVVLTHGGGGTEMAELISKLILPSINLRRVLNGVGLDELDDGATVPIGEHEVAITTDGHTVDPIFFPGGDIGRLAVSGTINDLAALGAKPLAMTSALIIEEGFSTADLEKILKSMSKTAEEVPVAIISGDTKVMPKGKIDRIVVVTTGIGMVKRGAVLLDSKLKPGDAIIVTGTIGDHGIALASVREGIEFSTPLVSDVAPVWDVMEAALSIGGVTAAKDPTRGGVAAALNEMATKSKVSIWISEDRLPIRDEVKAASEMLGLDPLQVTCEGKLILGVEPEYAGEVLKAIKKTTHGRSAEIIGEARVERPGYVIMETVVGGRRIVEMPIGEPIPRVC